MITRSLNIIENVNLPIGKQRLVIMRVVHHCISLAGTFVTLFFFFYLALDYTVGLIPWVHNWYMGPIPGRSVVFTAIILTIIIRYIKIRSPYSKY